MAVSIWMSMWLLMAVEVADCLVEEITGQCELIGCWVDRPAWLRAQESWDTSVTMKWMAIMGPSDGFTDAMARQSCRWLDASRLLL